MLTAECLALFMIKKRKWNEGLPVVANLLNLFHQSTFNTANYTDEETEIRWIIHAFKNLINMLQRGRGRSDSGCYMKKK